MNGQGWGPSQVGYHSDSSSHGYFSCEDSLSACQIDNVEFQHQAQFEAMRSAPPVPPCDEQGLGAITFRSGTQLKEPTGESPNSDSITSEERNLRRNVEDKDKSPTTEQETASGHNERVVDPTLTCFLSHRLPRKGGRLSQQTHASLSSSKRWK
ncbi:hypothetical protein PIB30_102904 [Stylosanthes scabra]|uniref:Uncharacterized protein n=1 Tax=Stylosanthes scabra TaxID=79078 RepID=A0ABU6RYG2_9FABA|nr:hypothetical protein [Stylosanthes scabra]